MGTTFSTPGSQVSSSESTRRSSPITPIMVRSSPSERWGLNPSPRIWSTTASTSAGAAPARITTIISLVPLFPDANKKRGAGNPTLVGMLVIAYGALQTSSVGWAVAGRRKVIGAHLVIAKKAIAVASHADGFCAVGVGFRAHVFCLSLFTRRRCLVE